LNDKSLGYTIMIVTALIMIGYFVWALGPYIGLSTWITIAISEWAYKLPILAAVYIMLFIVLWIGYTMATTPPPIPLDNPLDLDREGDKEEPKEEK
jgi:hypothetical protein